MSPALPGSVAARVRRVHAHLTRRVRLAALLWGAAALAWVLVVAWVLAGPDGWSQGTWAPLVLDSLALLLAAGALATAWEGPRRWLVESRVARAMEEAAGLGAGAVEGALQLSRRLPAGVSASLAAHGEGRVARRLGAPDARLAGVLDVVAGRWVRRGMAGLALFVPVAALLLAASPERATSAWGGLGAPLRLLASPVLPPLAVEPGDAEVLRGSPLDVTVLAAGRSEITLSWRTVGDVPRQRTVATAGGGARFRFDEVSAEIRYRVSAPDGATSSEYRLTPVDPLLVSEVVVSLTFPPHTGRAVEEYRGDAPPLVVPAGTRIRVRGRASGPLAEAGLEREGDGEAVTLRTDGRAFAGAWSPSRSGVYHWRFTGEGGGAAVVAPAPLDLTLVPDAAPSVRFAFPGRDTVLPLDLRQPLVIESRDDHGLAMLELVAYRVTSLGERQPPVTQRLALGGTRAALARPVMDLSTWGLLPGDTVRYYARVADNAPSPGEALTREYVLRMPGATELRRDAQELMEGMAQRLDSLAERASEASEAARDAQRRGEAERRRREGARSEGEASSAADFQEREELRRALEEQRSMLGEVDSARAELNALAEALRQAGAADPGLQDDLRELQRLLEEAAPEAMRARLEEMARQLDDPDMEGASEALRQLAEDREAFRRRLEQSLERLRRAAVEQDFRAAEAEAERLALQEEALSDALRAGDRPELRAQQQERLAAETRALQERIQGLERHLGELGEEDARQGAERAGQRTQEAQQAMREARQMMGALDSVPPESTQAQTEAAPPPSPPQAETQPAGTPPAGVPPAGAEPQTGAQPAGAQPPAGTPPAGAPPQTGPPPSPSSSGTPRPSAGGPEPDPPLDRAGAQAQRAAQGLQQAAQELRDAQQQMAQRKAQRAQGALRQAAGDALALARRQSSIGEEIRASGAQRMPELRGDEAALMQGLRTMADNLQAAAGEGMEPGAMRQMMGQMGRAMQAMQETVDAMEGRRGASPSPAAAAEVTVEALNRLALSAMAGARDMAQGGQAGDQQGASAQERLDRLAQQQGGLNNQAGQIMPMQLGQQAMAAQMQGLARGQRQVASRLSELAREPGAQGETLGDLQALAREAAALAERLRGGRLDGETRERQERLFHRLLDAGRSLENEEVSEERESETAGVFERGEVTPLNVEALGGLPFVLPDAAALGRLMPAERQLVIEYFERLNRETRGRTEPPPGGGS